MITTPSPLYSSYEDYRNKVPVSEILRKCVHIARNANRARLFSPTASVRLRAGDVFLVLDSARGECRYCKSLAVENRPSSVNGAPLPWGHVGRRIGSLDHVIARFNGGDNHADNLVWACLWCNTWDAERIPYAQDHGPVYPTPH